VKLVFRILISYNRAGRGRLHPDRPADPGAAKVYQPQGAYSAGEATLADREEAVDATAPGQAPSKEYYTWNVRVVADLGGGDGPPTPASGPAASGPLAPSAVGGLRPPD
jgi:hypothetical protein